MTKCLAVRGFERKNHKGEADQWWPSRTIHLLKNQWLTRDKTTLCGFKIKKVRIYATELEEVNCKRCLSILEEMNKMNLSSITENVLNATIGFTGTTRTT